MTETVRASGPDIEFGDVGTDAEGSYVLPVTIKGSSGAERRNVVVRPQIWNDIGAAACKELIEETIRAVYDDARIGRISIQPTAGHRPLNMPPGFPAPGARGEQLPTIDLPDDEA